MILTKDDVLARHCTIYLNGEDITHMGVTEANEEAGYVVCLEMEPLPEGADPKKTIRKFVVGKDGPVTYMLRGLVHIEIPEDKRHLIGLTRRSRAVVRTDYVDPETGETKEAAILQWPSSGEWAMLPAQQKAELSIAVNTDALKELTEQLNKAADEFGRRGAI